MTRNRSRHSQPGLPSPTSALWRTIAAATVALAAVGAVTMAEPEAAHASPYELTPANDPRIPANCPGGFGSNGLGGTTWCRVSGIDITTASTGSFRWAGQYAFITDDGSGPKVSYGWCLDDSGSHPKVQYGVGDMTDGRTLAEALHGPLAHPEGAAFIPQLMGLVNDGIASSRSIPGYTTVFSPEELSAGVWAVQHYVVGDRTSSNVVVVPQLDNWVVAAARSSPGRLHQLARELWAYGSDHVGLNFTLDAGPVTSGGDVTFTVRAESVGGPLAASEMYFTVDWATNLEWATSGLPFTGPLGFNPLGVPPTDVTLNNGMVSFDLRLVDPLLPGEMHVEHQYVSADSWRGYLATGGQQSTGVYFAPADIAVHAQTAAIAPIGYLQVSKTSSDQHFSAQGATFQLIDAGGAGSVVASATTDGSGIARFPLIDLSAVTLPLVLHESVAPPGLTPAADVTVPAVLSRDPNAPTVVDIVDTPVARQMRVVKTLSDPSVGPRDLSNFGFTITRDDGVNFGSPTTDRDGTTAVIAVTAGSYRVCETSAPPWWSAALGGCKTLIVDAVGTSLIEFSYENVVGSPSCATQLRDVADHDQVLPTGGGTVIDTVRCSGLVPQTTYTLTGELQRRADDGTVTPSGITASTTFVATAAAQSVDVGYTVPGGHACSVFVAFETLSTGGHAVATHADAADVDQTVYLPQITTNARTTTGGRMAMAGDGLVDRVTYCGLPAGTYSANADWQRATPGTGGSPTCAAASTTGSATFTVSGSVASGSVDVGGATVPLGGSGTFVAFESVRTLGAAQDIATHRACDDLGQTVWRPSLVTTRVEPEPEGPGTNHDVVVVRDLPPASVLGGRTVRIVGGLHQHDSTSAITSRQCSIANRVASFEMAISGDGEHRSPGEAHAPGFDYSYQEHLVVNPAPGLPTGTADQVTGSAGAWTSADHGCTVVEQTFRSHAVVVALATPDEVPQPAPDLAAGDHDLPVTGTSALALGTCASWFLAGGIVLLMAGRRRRMTAMLR